MLQKRRFIPHLEKWGHSRPFRVKKFWKILASSIWRGFFDVRLLNQCVKTWLREKRRFLRFARNLRPHCFGEGNRVEHFSEFGRICSTFGVALPGFGELGRQKSDISSVFCLLSESRGPDLNSRVDKNQTFLPFFVYFRVCAGRIRVVG